MFWFFLNREEYNKWIWCWCFLMMTIVIDCRFEIKYISKFWLDYISQLQNQATYYGHWPSGSMIVKFEMPYVIKYGNYIKLGFKRLLYSNQLTWFPYQLVRLICVGLCTCFHTFLWQCSYELCWSIKVNLIWEI